MVEKAIPSRAGWANALLIPVKQHAFCCVILPPLVNAAFGANAAEMLHSLPGEIALGVVVPPVVTYGTMWAEQKWHDWKRNRQDSCGCREKTLTMRNFIRQTALSYVFYCATALVSHNIWPHEHEDEHHTAFNKTAVLKIQQKSPV